MNRKDLDLIEDMLMDARHERPLYRPAWDYLSDMFAQELANRSDRFDKQRFLEAAGRE